MDPAQPKRVAVFVDVENVSGAFQNPHLSPLSWISEEGKVFFAQAYGNWTSPGIAAAMNALNEVGAKLIQPSSNHCGKNSADMHLALDALELCLGSNPPETIVIISNDRDFVPLILKLRERHIRVVGAGIEGNTSKDFVSLCDKFVALKIGANQLEPAPVKPLPVPVLKSQESAPSPSQPAKQLSGAKPLPITPSNGKPKVEAAMKALVSVLTQASTANPPRHSVDLPNLGALLKQLSPGFSLKAVGYSKLTALVSEAAARGLVVATGSKTAMNVRLLKPMKPANPASEPKLAALLPAKQIDPAAPPASAIAPPDVPFRAVFCTHVLAFLKSEGMLFFDRPTLPTLRQYLTERFENIEPLKEAAALDDLISRLLDSGGMTLDGAWLSLGRTSSGHAFGKKSLVSCLESSYVEEVLELNPGCQIDPVAAAKWLYSEANESQVTKAATAIKLAEARIALIKRQASPSQPEPQDHP